MGAEQALLGEKARVKILQFEYPKRANPEEVRVVVANLGCENRVR